MLCYSALLHFFLGWCVWSEKVLCESGKISRRVSSVGKPCDFGGQVFLTFFHVPQLRNGLVRVISLWSGGRSASIFSCGLFNGPRDSEFTDVLAPFSIWVIKWIIYQSLLFDWYAFWWQSLCLCSQMMLGRYFWLCCQWVVLGSMSFIWVQYFSAKPRSGSLFPLTFCCVFSNAITAFHCGSSSGSYQSLCYLISVMDASHGLL